MELKRITKPFYVDHKTYWTSTQTAEEGSFLVSILNSEEVNQVIKPFQSMGLLGERDIHKKVLEIPIPQYDKKDETHQRLAEIASEAATKVKAAVSSGQIKGTLARTRAAARALVSKELRKSTRLVKKILS